MLDDVAQVHGVEVEVGHDLALHVQGERLNPRHGRVDVALEDGRVEGELGLEAEPPLKLVRVAEAHGALCALEGGQDAETAPLAAQKPLEGARVR